MSVSEPSALDLRVLLRDGPMGSLWSGALGEDEALVRVFPAQASSQSSRVREAVRRMSQARHAGIAPVLHFGIVGAEQARRSGGLLPKGRLYCLTEAPRGPAIQARRRPLGWRRLREAVLELLTTLGWLHARGLIHGDLSSGGVEIDDDGHVRVRDVGLRLAAEQDGLVPVRQTQRLPPELRSGRWREVGPWTDLYMLGRMVEQVLGDDLERLPVVQAWVERLLDRRNRLLRAADARRVLLSLEGRSTDVYAPMVSRKGRTLPAAEAGSDLVGREDTCVELWSQLGEVRSDGGVRLVLLQGSSGVGKTAVAEWLCRRAHEAGVATVLRTEYSETSERTGLARMVANYLGVGGQDDPELDARLTQRLDALGIENLYERRGLADLVKRSSSSTLRELAGRRDALVRRFLEHCSDPPGGPRRAVLLCMEDVHQGLEALAFVRHLLVQGQNLPVLVLLTARDEDLEDSLAGEAVSVLFQEAGSRGSRLSLRALSVEDQVRLARDRLGVPEELARQVAFRTRGNPLHAVQLVAAWHDRGLVTRSPEGQLKLVGDRPLALPDAMDAVWLDRLSVAIPQRTSDEWLAMEVAAVLGRSVDLKDWTAVCERWGVKPCTHLIGPLCDRELLQAEGVDGFRFSYASLQLALEKVARREGRLEAHHRACAAVLADGGQPERLAVHHLGAGDAELALEPLIEAAEQRIGLGDFEHAERLIALWGEAMEAARHYVEDHRRTIGWTLLARIRRGQSRTSEAFELAQRAEQRARWSNDPVLIGEALVEMGLAARDLGDLGHALSCLTQAEALFEVAKEARSLARSRLEAAAVLGDLGAFDDAWTRYDMARTFCEDVGDGIGMAEAIRGQGDLEIRRGDLELAMGLLNQARREFEAVGYPQGAAGCHNSLGRLAQVSGDLAEAERHYRACERIARGAGDSHAAIAQANRGVVLVLQGQYAEARRVLEVALEQLEARSLPQHVAACRVHLLPALAGIEDWAGVDAHYGLGVAMLLQLDQVDPALGGSALLAGDLAAETQPVRARKLYELALRQFRLLGMSEEIGAVRIRMSKLPSEGE